MKTLSVLVGGAAVVSLFCDVAAPANPARQLNLLVSLPSLGTVYWQCTERPHRYRLSFRIFQNGATTEVRLLADGRNVFRRADPGVRVALPAAGLRQRLLLRQFTGAGTVTSTVEVAFLRRPVASHCYGYSPPQLRVSVSPRR